jgi:hypothetical protein
MIRRLAAIGATLALVLAALVGAAAPANAVRWVGQDCYDSLGYRHTMWVYAHDYGSYERVLGIQFVIRGGSVPGTGIRKLYDNGAEDYGVKLWDAPTGTTRYITTRSWYDQETLLTPGADGHGIVVPENATIGADLTVDVILASDRTYNCVKVF